jgi:NADH-dependent peroxiredoxin subunit F
MFPSSCHNCPDVVQALNTMAALNPNIQHVMIDGALYQDEVNAPDHGGAQRLAERRALRPGPHEPGRDRRQARYRRGGRDAAKLAEQAPFDVLVVGGGPAGSAAAIYAARKGIRTGVVAERFGGQVMDTLAIENLISVPHTDGPKLGRALEQHVKEYDVDIMNLQRSKR